MKAIKNLLKHCSCIEDCTPPEPTLLVVPIESLDFRNLERYCALNASFIVPMRPPPEGFGDSDALQREKLVIIYPEFQTMHPNQLTVP